MKSLKTLLYLCLGVQCLWILSCAQEEIKSEFDEGAIPPCSLSDVIFNSTDNQVCIYEDEGVGLRYVNSNGIPDYNVTFNLMPTPQVLPQTYTFSFPLTPKPATTTSSPLTIDQTTGELDRNYFFGVTTTGIPIVSYLNDFYKSGIGTDTLNYDWQYVATSANLTESIDAENGTLFDSAYVYVGVPNHLVKDETYLKHSSLIGYAADGYPIYFQYAYANADVLSSTVTTLTSSYRLRTGARPSGVNIPQGDYDGTFEQDYEYVAQSGDLDECNARFGKTPEYPEGTYYYVITTEYPYLPKCFIGTPDLTFVREK